MRFSDRVRNSTELMPHFNLREVFAADNSCMPEALAKAQIAGLKSAAEVAAILAESYVSFLSMQNKGVDLVITVNDIVEGEADLYSALPFIPMTSKGSIKLVDQQGNVVKKVAATALKGHNDYKVVDAAKAAKVKQSLLDYYFKHAPAPKIDYVRDLTLDGLPSDAHIFPMTGEIKLNECLLDEKWKHVHDGYLMEELQHFQQLHSRGWIGRVPTQAEMQMLEEEVVRRLLKSGLEIYDPGR